MKPQKRKETTIAGPAAVAAAWPVRTKIPAPIIAPIPSVIKFTGPSARRRECSPLSFASSRITSKGLVASSALPMLFPPLRTKVLVRMLRVELCYPRESTCSAIAKYSRTRSAGSFAVTRSLTTATESAPARKTASADSIVIPPMATRGFCVNLLAV